MWSQVNNLADCGLARIWLTWDSKIWNCNIIHLSAQVIAGVFTNKGGFSFVFGAVYGHNDRRQREQLWQDITHIGGISKNQYWVLLLLAGDFNAILSNNEKSRRKVRSRIDTCRFPEVLDASWIKMFGTYGTYMDMD